MSPFAERIRHTTEFFRDKLPAPIDNAVILGSGLKQIVAQIEIQAELSYTDIPGLSAATAPTHAGRLMIGTLADRQVAVCQGRLHLYEGHSAQQVAMLVYLLAGLGAKTLITTNAAGALNTAFQTGDIMVINDHINVTGHNPLLGEDDSLGNRFADMSRAYDQSIAANALRFGSNRGLAIHTGVYAGVLGPSLETSAERRMLRQWGADAVGMSTVMEVIAANHIGMRVMGLSAITNLAFGDANQQVDTLDEVLKNAAIADKGISQIIVDCLDAQK